MRGKVFKHHLLSSLLFVFIIAGCGGGESRGFGEVDGALAANEKPINGATVSFDIPMFDSYYGYSDSNMTSAPVWTVPSGVDILLNFDNQGKLKHNWAIVKPNIAIPVPYEDEQSSDILLYGMGMVFGNSKSTATFAAPDSGTYQIICTVSGHYPFMQGKLVVAAN